MVRKTILSFVSALLLIGCAQGTPRPDSSELDALLRAGVENRRVPAVVAMAATKEGIVYEGAVGLRTTSCARRSSSTLASDGSTG